MACFFLVCGNHTFQNLLKGYENVTVQCQNCGNWSGKLISRWEWIHLCFIPIIPLSMKPWHAVHCDICNFDQDIQYRPDVQQQMDQIKAGGGGGGQGGQQIPMQTGPPPGGNQQQQQYQQGGQPVYQPQNQQPPGGQPQYK